MIKKVHILFAVISVLAFSSIFYIVHTQATLAEDAPAPTTPATTVTPSSTVSPV